MEKYRVLTPSKTRVEYILSMISLLLVLGGIVYLLLLWGDLPRRIPIHFNLVGKADGWMDGVTNGCCGCSQLFR